MQRLWSINYIIISFSARKLIECSNRAMKFKDANHPYSMVCAKLSHSTDVAEKIYAIAGQDVPALTQALALESVHKHLISGEVIEDIKRISRVSWL